MWSLADSVREMNAVLWAPDAEFNVTPRLLSGEPIVVDSYQSVDGRVWCRTYLDGSAIDQNGIVWQRAPGLARALDAAAVGAGLGMHIKA